MRLLLALFLVAAALPAQADDILSIARHDGRFTTLVAAIDAAGLTGTLEGDGPFTVFAPTDEAFSALPPGTVQDLLRAENRDRLAAILTYHVVAGRIEASDLLGASQARTASGESLSIGLSIGGAAIVQTDIHADNGIIHVIDAVLIPPQLPGAATSSSDAADIIRLAIERGAPLYNRGQVEACAAIYEVAAEALLYADDLPSDAERAIRQGLRRARAAHGSDDAAWRLREGFDAALASLEPTRRMMSAGH